MPNLKLTLKVLGVRLAATYSGQSVTLGPQRFTQATGEVVSGARADLSTSIDIGAFGSWQDAVNSVWEPEAERFAGCLALISPGET